MFSYTDIVVDVQLSRTLKRICARYHDTCYLLRWYTSYNPWTYIYFSPFRSGGGARGCTMTCLSSMSCYATDVSLDQQEHCYRSPQVALIDALRIVLSRFGLNGPDGPDGPNGPTGSNGPQRAPTGLLHGLNGPDGHDGPNGPNGLDGLERPWRWMNPSSLLVLALHFTFNWEDQRYWEYRSHPRLT